MFHICNIKFAPEAAAVPKTAIMGLRGDGCRLPAMEHREVGHSHLTTVSMQFPELLGWLTVGHAVAINCVAHV